MSDQHLRNAIRYLERIDASNVLSSSLIGLRKEQKRRIKCGIMVRPQKKEDTLIFGDE